jgi:hypothetical protein
MSFIMHRVFCATPEDLEAERQAFHDALGDFNEKASMARGILFVPVSIPSKMADKRPFQQLVDENIRSCRYYAQVIGNDRSAPQRNFEQDYALAMECATNPAWPMCEVVVLVRQPAPAESPEAHQALRYSDIDEYAAHWRGLLARWLESMVAK